MEIEKSLVNKDLIPLVEVERYIAAGGDYCPYCKSPEVQEDGLMFYDFETVKIYRPMECLTCFNDWTDVFSLSGIM
jgi:hypothetical protein